MSNTSSKVHDQLVTFGITPKSIYRNLSVEKLVEQSVQTNEGMLTSTGSLSVKTGKYTGRSPQDRYIIYDDETHEPLIGVMLIDNSQLKNSIQYLKK